jgi:hypothetical protein
MDISEQRNRYAVIFYSIDNELLTRYEVNLFKFFFHNLTFSVFIIVYLRLILNHLSVV